MGILRCVTSQNPHTLYTITYEQDLNLEGKNYANYENVLGSYQTSENMFDTLVLLGHLIVQQGAQSYFNLMVRNSQSSVTPMQCYPPDIAEGQATKQTNKHPTWLALPLKLLACVISE